LPVGTRWDIFFIYDTNHSRFSRADFWNAVIVAVEAGRIRVSADKVHYPQDAPLFMKSEALGEVTIQ
jgi:hypothetical protein